MTLDELVALIHANGEDGGFAIDLPDAWTQGRTAYGGITAGLALAATRAVMPDLPPLRSAQVAFIAPLGGMIAFAPRLLRRGRSAAYVAVEVTGGSGLGASINFIFAADRESAVSVPAPVERVSAGQPVTPPPQVRFAQNFEQWAVAANASVVDRLVRLKVPSAVDVEVEMLAVADLLPPPALFNFDAPVPLSSMNWHIDLIGPARRSDDRLWRVRNVAEMHERGLSTQAMWMWDGEGRLVASGRQLVALFG